MYNEAGITGGGGIETDAKIKFELVSACALEKRVENLLGVAGGGGIRPNTSSADSIECCVIGAGRNCIGEIGLGGIKSGRTGVMLNAKLSTLSS